MTFENSKRLYEHYLAIGNAQNANELLDKYPELAEKPKEEPVEEEKPKAKKKAKK